MLVGKKLIIFRFILNKLIYSF